MLVTERYGKIMDLLNKDGAVSRVKLAEILGVTPETVRRDLCAMEKEGLLVRVHGGAVAKKDMELKSSLEKRLHENTGLKRELSEKAAEFIREGDIIGIDAGSTAAVFAEVVKEKFTRLTVITQSIDVFNTLCSYAKFSLILCGGVYKSEERCFDGALTVQMLENIHMQKAFICPSAVSNDLEIYNFYEDVYFAERQMIKSSDRVFVLADSTKYGKTAMYRLDTAKRDYTFITDGGLSDEMMSHFHDIGGKVYCGGRRPEIMQRRSVNDANE